MIIRNIKYNKLNETEKRIVDSYYEECKKDYESRNKEKYYRNGFLFWEDQRNELTYNESGGLYNGWIDTFCSKCHKEIDKLNDLEREQGMKGVFICSDCINKRENK